MYFYRDSNGNEVDLLIKKGAGYDCIEIKSAETFHTDFTKGIEKFEKEYPELVKDKYVIYGGESMPDLPVKIINYTEIP